MIGNTSFEQRRTLAAYPCSSAALRGIRARVVSFNKIHRSDHVFVVAAMYSASVGIGGLVGSRPIWSYSSSAFSREHRVRGRSESNVRLHRLTIRGPNSTRYKSRQSSWYSVKNALDDATPDSRDKVFATTMVQQFDKTFRQLFAAARMKFKSSKLPAFSFIFRR